MEAVKAEIVSCDRCDGMNIHDVTQAAPGYGSPESPGVVVGQSLCGKPCMRAQIPFTGGSGRFLNLSLECAGLSKSDIFTTNVVHCHPPGNRPSLPQEVENCRLYLLWELEIIQPRLVIGLGKDASAALRDVYPNADELAWPFIEPRGRKRTAASPRLLAAPHPSWIKWKPQEQREEYVESLACALRWEECWRAGDSAARRPPHGCHTMLLDGGTTAIATVKWLGHDPAITLRVYGHVYDDALAAAGDALLDRTRAS